MHRSASILAIVLLALVVVPAGAQQTFLNKSADTWAPQLTAQDPMARRSAAFALGKCKSVNHAQALLKALADDDEEVREAAAFALGEIYGGAKANLPKGLVKALAVRLQTDRAAGVRRGAASALGMIGPAVAKETDGSMDARDALTAALANNDARVRQNAAWAFGEIGTPAMNDAVPQLGKLLHEQDALVKRDAAVSLSKAGKHAKAAVPGLAKVLVEDDLIVRRYAAMALGNLGEEGAAAKDALPALKKALGDSDPFIRKFVALALFHLGKGADEAVPELTQALADADAEVRRNSAAALAQVGPPARAALPALIKLIKEEPHPRVREQVADVFINLDADAEPAIDAMIEALEKDKDATVRKNCAVALAFKRFAVHDKVNDALKKAALNDKSEIVRYQSAYGIAMNLGPDGKEVVPTLLEFIKDKGLERRVGTSGTASTGGAETGMGGTTVKSKGEGDGRSLAADALAKIGSVAGPKAKAALEDAAKSTSKELADAAKAALEAFK